MCEESSPILVVEDDPGHAELLARSFESWGIANRLAHVADGETALDYLFARGQYAGPPPAPSPQLILLDLRLPRIDGFEVLRQIKAAPRLRAIPVVVLSSSEEDRDVARANELRADHYLLKPLSFFKLAQLAHELGFHWLLLKPPETPGR